MAVFAFRREEVIGCRTRHYGQFREWKGEEGTPLIPATEKRGGDGGGGMEEAQKRTFHACLEGGRSSLLMFTIRQKSERSK